ncbi:MAG: zinc ribbon domain-containing protein [Candidatus Helarchaeota archaeon]
MGSRFKPWSTETEIPNTKCTIQVGDVNGKWAVVIRKILDKGNKKAIALKKIQKLTDTNIISVIKDTIGKEYALDTFTLGSTMSRILREVYEKIKSSEKSKDSGQPVQPVKPVAIKQASTKPVSTLASSKKRHADSFWSAYDAASSYSGSTSESQPPAQPPAQPQPQPQFNQPQIPPSTPNVVYQPPANPPPSIPAQAIDDSSELDDILSDLGLSCPHCGMEVGPDDEVCPHCGKKIQI